MQKIDKDNINLEDILSYINNNYETTAMIISKWGEEVIEIINKKSNTPENYFSFEICPEWGFAPGKMLMHCNHENKKECSGCGYARVYKGTESIDDFMKECNIKKRNQMSIFDFEGV